jgi:hypothetical protein
VVALLTRFPIWQDISRSHIRGFERLQNEPAWNYTSRDHLLPLKMPDERK